MMLEYVLVDVAQKVKLRMLKRLYQDVVVN